MPERRSWIDGPINFLMWLSCFTGFVMMLHVSVDVVGRVVFNSPLYATTEIVSGYYMVAIAFLPLAYVARHEGHIFVELFTRGLSQRGLVRLEAAVNVIAFAYMCLFTWLTGLRALDRTEAREVWETAGGFIPIWPSRWLLPVGGALMAIYLLVRIREDLARAARS